MSSVGPALRDIHVPPASWWPPAPGWWIVAGGLVLLVALVVMAAWRRSRRGRAGILQVVSREIAGLESEFERHRDTAKLAAGASRLLRRIAMRIEPAIAAQEGDAWRDFLHRRAPDTRTATALDALATAPFQVRPTLDAPSLLGALRTWCTHACRAGASVDVRGRAEA